MESGKAFCLLFLAFARQLGAETQGTFSNPLFRGQDPWLTQWNGSYYYSESDGASIRIRTAPTLTGLAQAPARLVWSSAYPMTNLWAPEVHFEDGRWYIYYSADHRSDRHHGLYVLQGGSDPFDPYTPGDTGVTGGRLPESSGRWGIDADVFRGSDDSLYLTWSCAESPIGDAPQSICLARMADPLHFASETVRIATPDRPWERRTAAIEEGPVGFTRDGLTYITYSGSSSWMTNDYSVGLLVNAGDDLLDPAGWNKYGPILDRHAGTWGPGSAVFIPSPDGTELWNVYHAYDQVNCPAWSCRSIRMQKVRFGDHSLPVLGYPADPFVQTDLPSGDAGSPTGWGGSRSGTPAAGRWLYRSAGEAETEADDLAQSFRGSADLWAWEVSASIVVHSAGEGSRYGIYPLYQDAGNFVELYLDPKRLVVGIRSVVAGQQGEPLEAELPQGFNAFATHALRARKSAAGSISASLDGWEFGSLRIELAQGQTGIFARSTAITFRDVARTDQSYGWTDLQGLWEIADDSTAISASGAGGAGAMLTGNPNFSDISGGVRVVLPDDQSSAGLIICSDDHGTRLTLWLNPAAGAVELSTNREGFESREFLAWLPASERALVRRLGFSREGSLVSFYVDDLLVGQRVFETMGGLQGVITDRENVRFEGFQLSSRPRLFGPETNTHSEDQSLFLPEVPADFR